MLLYSFSSIRNRSTQECARGLTVRDDTKTETLHSETETEAFANPSETRPRPKPQWVSRPPRDQDIATESETTLCWKLSHRCMPSLVQTTLAYQLLWELSVAEVDEAERWVGVDYLIGYRLNPTLIQLFISVIQRQRRKVHHWNTAGCRRHVAVLLTALVWDWVVFRLVDGRGNVRVRRVHVQCLHETVRGRTRQLARASVSRRTTHTSVVWNFDHSEATSF